MTPQEHINAIGAALASAEDAHAKLGNAIKRLHRSLNKAQAAYAEQHDTDNVIQLFSTTDDVPGGTDKPDDNDPDEPVEP